MKNPAQKLPLGEATVMSTGFAVMRVYGAGAGKARRRSGAYLFFQAGAFVSSDADHGVI